MSTKTNTSKIKIVLFLFIGALLLFLVFRNIDLARMLDDLKKANYWWVLLSLIISLAANISRAYRWGLLIETVHQEPKLTNSFYALSVGYFANLAFPRLGEVTRCTAMYELEKAPFEKVVGTVIAERVVDLICLVILLVITLFSNLQQFSHFFYELLSGKLSFLNQLSSGLLITSILIFTGSLAVLILLRKKIMELGFAKKIVGFLVGIFQGFTAVFKLKKRGAFIFHSILIWLMYYLSTYVCFNAIPETTHLGLNAALFLLVLGALGMSAPVQGGFGAYHFIVASGLVLYGIVPYIDPVSGKEVSKGLVFATIVHSSQIILVVVLGIISLVMLNIAKRKQIAE